MSATADPRADDAAATGPGRRRVGPAVGLLAMLIAAPAAWPGVEVQVEGLEGAERQNVEARLAIRNIPRRGDAPGEAMVRRLHEQAEADIKEALQPFGYYQVSVSGTLAGAGDDWRADYRVERGPRTHVRQVDLRIEGAGAGRPELAPAAALIAQMQDQPLDHRRYEQAKSALAANAYGLGYIDVRYTRAELRVLPERDRAELYLTLETGPQYFFGQLQLDTPGLDPELVRRYLRITPGAPYDPQAVLDSQFELIDLGYFDGVAIEPLREAADPADPEVLPMRVRTTLRPKRRYDFGIGYGTDTGARLSAGAEFRRINLKGHKLKLTMRLSEIKNDIGAEYLVPVGERAVEQLGFFATSLSERFEDGNSLKYTLGTALTRMPGKWRRRTYLNYEHEESQLGAARQTADLVIPGIAMDRNELDDPIHARRGWSLYGDLHGAHKAIPGSTSFLQLRVQARGALPVGAKGRVLGRIEQGVSEVEEFEELPASQRFFAGGDQSVRGYRYHSLGPVDAAGKVVGGRYLSTYSLEYEHSVWRNWGAAVFVDAGNAGDDPDMSLARGVGLGVRYRAPIGYVQLDFAHPLDGDNEGVRLHLAVRVGL